VRVTTMAAGSRVLLHTVLIEADGRHVEDEGRAIAEGVRLELSPGSYVLEASAPGRYATRLPILLARAADANIAIPLPLAALVPSGFLYVPAGTSLVGATDAEELRNALFAEPEHPVHVDPFLIGEEEVTYAEYLDFLASLPPAERLARRPHTSDLEITFDRDDAPSLRLGSTTTRPGEPICHPKRSVRRCLSWLRLPVAGIALDDVQAYAAWLARRVPGARLCSGREWERAARGADGRLYPHGDVMHPGDANFDATYATDDEQMGADEVGSFPADRSPFGVLDLGGNVREWVAAEGDSRVGRGGRWHEDTISARAAYRYVRGRAARFTDIGIRVCAEAPKEP